MKSCALIITSFCTLALAQAQQGRVLQVKGNRAIVEFPAGSVAKGTVVSADGSSSMGSVGGGSESRANILGLTFGLATSSGSGTSATAISVTGTYGWNAITMEYGPKVSLTSLSGGSSSATAISLGGFFDYNLVPNKPGVSMVYGLGATLSFNSLSGSGSSSSSTTPIFLGGNLKWFPLGHAVAIRADGGLTYTPGSGGSAATTAFGITGGLYVYF